MTYAVDMPHTPEATHYRYQQNRCRNAIGVLIYSGNSYTTDRIQSFCLTKQRIGAVLRADSQPMKTNYPTAECDVIFRQSMLNWRTTEAKD